MNWHSLKDKDRFLGFEIKTPTCYYFFGSGQLPLPEMQERFSQYHFRFMKQVHGNTMVQASSAPSEADAQWSDEKNVALVVQTADCIPLLFGSSHLVAAVHAGWRGVELEIANRAAQFFSQKGIRPERALLGPHLQAQDFEVGKDVAARLVAVHERLKPKSTALLPHPDPQKAKVNLSQIVTDQIRAHLGFDFPVEVSSESTLNSPDFHSFRRGNQGARQYSFVTLL